MEKVKSKSPVDMEKCMPTPPDRVGREFVRQYYTIMNMSPQHLYCFYTDNATFIHDDANANERRTISVEGKMAIRDMMADRLPGFQHTSTKIDQVDTMKTLDNGLLVQILGEISFNEQPMRSFSQTIILTPQTPFKYFVCNDIFRFVDFEDAVDDDLAIVTQPTVEKDWGTQCEEESEQTEPRVARAAEQNDNEVKLDNSDSGLSSDAEKVIMDMQSMNLKNILQESRSITKESVRIRSPLAAEVEPTQVESDDANQSGNRSQLFRDSCILTVGNVVNPNIEFEEENSAEKASDMSPDSMDTVRGANEDGQTSKGKQRKRNRRKHKADKSNDEPADGKPTESVHDTSESTESHETSTPENATEMSGEQPAQPDENPEQEPPKAAPEFKTYADLARGGNQPWVDELATRNEPVRPVERSKSRPSLVRRNSRNDKPSPPSKSLDSIECVSVDILLNFQCFTYFSMLAKIFVIFIYLLLIFSHFSLILSWMERP